MLQNTKLTASLKWNNYYEGLTSFEIQYKAVIAHIKNIRWKALGTVNTLRDSLSEKKLSCIVGQVPQNYP